MSERGLHEACAHRRLKRPDTPEIIVCDNRASQSGYAVSLGVKENEADKTRSRTCRYAGNSHLLAKEIDVGPSR